MFDVFVVGCGGFVGAALRYICMMFINSASAGVFPWATFLINTIGCFFIGFFSVILPSYYPAQKAPLLFFTTGLIGGYTAISTFGLETVGLMEEGQMFMAGGYVLATVAACLIGVFVGRLAGKIVVGN